MTDILQTPNNVKVDLARELAKAQRAADAFYGAGPVAHFQGENRFDYDNPRTGHLEHNFKACPYCALRTLRRILSKRGNPHGQNIH